MRVCLIALPWNVMDRPSTAIGALAAYLQRERPEHEVESRFEFLKIAGRIGFSLYDAIANSSWLMGDLLYMPQIYPEKREDVLRAFSEWAATEAESNEAFRSVREDCDWGINFDRMQDVLRDHLNEVAAQIGTGHDLVGMTTCFGQLFANLALGKKVKEASPGTRIVLGDPRFRLA
jgi:hypothetical protein